LKSEIEKRLRALNNPLIDRFTTANNTTKRVDFTRYGRIRNQTFYAGSSFE
jgi:hypothetical protein